MNWSKSFSCGKTPYFLPFSCLTHLENRAEEEDAQFDEGTLQTLASVARESNLRYALNLISTANMISKKRKSEKIAVADVKRAYEYFLDLTRSQEWLKGQLGKLIFEEGEQQSEDRMDQS